MDYRYDFTLNLKIRWLQFLRNKKDNYSLMIQ